MTQDQRARIGPDGQGQPVVGHRIEASVLAGVWRAVEARALGLCSLLAAVVLGLGLAWPWHPGEAAASAALAMQRAGEEARATQAVHLRVRADGDAGPIDLSAAVLWSLGRREVLTSVPWEPVRRRWAGVSLRGVLEHAGAAGRAVRVRALNGYAAVIPWEDVMRFDPILAMTVDGQPIAMRSKGPIVVIYPYDRHEALARTAYWDRAVWHVDELVVM